MGVCLMCIKGPAFLMESISLTMLPVKRSRLDSEEEIIPSSQPLLCLSGEDQKSCIKEEPVDIKQEPEDEQPEGEPAASTSAVKKEEDDSKPAYVPNEQDLRAVELMKDVAAGRVHRMKDLADSDGESILPERSLKQLMEMSSSSQSSFDVSIYCFVYVCSLC
jgi:hypothetical protein